MIQAFDGSLMIERRAEIRREVVTNRMEKRLRSNSRARSEGTPHEHRAYGYPQRTEGRSEAQGRRRSAVLLSLALGAVLAGVVALAATAREAEAAHPGDNGRIAFASSRTMGKGVDNPTGDFEIFTMQPDGTRIVQLTNNTAEDSQPSYSASGDEIVFTSRRDGNYEIYVMNADGTGQTRLTNNGFQDFSLDWQPLIN